MTSKKLTCDLVVTQGGDDVAKTLINLGENFTSHDFFKTFGSTASFLLDAECSDELKDCDAVLCKAAAFKQHNDFVFGASSPESLNRTLLVMLMEDHQWSYYRQLLKTKIESDIAVSLYAGFFDNKFLVENPQIGISAACTSLRICFDQPKNIAYLSLSNDHYETEAERKHLISLGLLVDISVHAAIEFVLGTGLLPKQEYANEILNKSPVLAYNF